jgi:hypothetical protein
VPHSPARDPDEAAATARHKSTAAAGQCSLSVLQQQDHQVVLQHQAAVEEAVSEQHVEVPHFNAFQYWQQQPLLQ